MKIQLKHALVLIFAAVCAAAPARTATQPFTLIIEVRESSVKVGSEVQIDVTLRNSSNRAMEVSMDLTEMDYALEVRDSQNKTPPETDFARKSKGRAHFSNDQIFTLQPGESLPKAALAVTKFYDLTRPGKYTIQVSRAVPKELGGGTIKSNAVIVTITE